MNEEFKSALEALKGELEGKSKEQAQAEIKAFEEKYKETVKAEAKSLFDEEIKAVKEEYAAEIKKVQDHADKLDAKLNAPKGVSAEKKGYHAKSVELITKNFDAIKNAGDGNKVKIEEKAMTLGTNLTGEQPRDYASQVVALPSEPINFSDILGASVTISGGTYTFPRETAPTGAVATQVEGAQKSEVDFNITMVDVNTDFLAGVTVYSKKMANNLPFLTSFLPEALRREYMFAENNLFHGVLSAAATASTVNTGNDIERIIANIGALEGARYRVTGVVVNPADWWTIMITEKSTGAGYGLPGVVTYDGSVLRINGIPVYKATWVPARQFYVGDFTRVRKVITEGLSLTFSEHERFSLNNIVAKIEAQIALAVEQPASMIYGFLDLA